MRKGIHPEYGYVVFKDATTGFSFLTRSTKTSEEKVKWEDGNEYPLITVEISSDSHPFYTGKEKQYEKEGRIEKFLKKYNAKSKTNKKKETKQEAAEPEKEEE